MPNIFASFTADTRCHTCRWWVPTADLQRMKEDTMPGTCHRYAPDHSGWPETHAFQSCGDWTFNPDND
jgi:hypothetical protein